MTIKNALFMPRAVGPLHVARAATLAAVERARARTPPTLAAFAQRTAADDEPDAAALHSIGCEVYLHALRVEDAGPAWLVLEGVRWIALDSIEPPVGLARTVRVSPVRHEEGDAAEVGPLADALRAHVRGLVASFPDSPRLLALVDRAEPAALADLVMANLPVSVEDKARYAAEPRLPERLRVASALSGLAGSRPA